MNWQKAKLQVNMAAMAEEGADNTIIFELPDGEIIEAHPVFNGKLTQDEREEISNIMKDIQADNGPESIQLQLDDPATYGQVTNQWHKSISSEELDQLASNNSSENTKYQTKWAVTVMRGKCTQYLYKFKPFSNIYGINYVSSIMAKETKKRPIQWQCSLQTTDLKK